MYVFIFSLKLKDGLANIFGAVNWSRYEEFKIPTLLRSLDVDVDDWESDTDPAALMLETFRYLYMQTDRSVNLLYPRNKTIGMKKCIN